MVQLVLCFIWSITDLVTFQQFLYLLVRLQVFRKIANEAIDVAQLHSYHRILKDSIRIITLCLGVKCSKWEMTFVCDSWTKFSLFTIHRPTALGFQKFHLIALQYFQCTSPKYPLAHTANDVERIGKKFFRWRFFVTLSEPLLRFS